MKLIELITGDDNVTLEPAYVWWAIGMLSIICIGLYSIYKGQPVNLQDFGIGFAAILAGGGAGKLMGK